MKLFTEWSSGVVSRAAHSLRDSSVLRGLIGDEEYDRILNKGKVMAENHDIRWESPDGTEYYIDYRIVGDREVEIVSIEKEGDEPNEKLKETASGWEGLTQDNIDQIIKKIEDEHEWPSRGRIGGYRSDHDHIDWSRGDI
jgi:hypothetical protein